ncbi:MAG: hypothetical protein RLP98_13575 [Devosia sp.]
MSIERADSQYRRDTANKRKIRIGGVTRDRSYSAVEIARALRKGKLEDLERKRAD